jgi:hypothetical protein
VTALDGPKSPPRGKGKKGEGTPTQGTPIQSAPPMEVSQATTASPADIDRLDEILNRMTAMQTSFEGFEVKLNEQAKEQTRLIGEIEALDKSIGQKIQEQLIEFNKSVDTDGSNLMNTSIPSIEPKEEQDVNSTSNKTADPPESEAAAQQNQDEEQEDKSTSTKSSDPPEDDDCAKERKESQPRRMHIHNRNGKVLKFVDASVEEFLHGNKLTVPETWNNLGEENFIKLPQSLLHDRTTRHLSVLQNIRRLMERVDPSTLENLTPSGFFQIPFTHLTSEMSLTKAWQNQLKREEEDRKQKDKSPPGEIECDEEEDASHLSDYQHDGGNVRHMRVGNQRYQHHGNSFPYQNYTHHGHGGQQHHDHGNQSNINRTCVGKLIGKSWSSTSNRNNI